MIDFDFQMILENLGIGAWATKSDGTILYTNHKYNEMRGLPKDWFIQHPNTYENNKYGMTSISPTKVVCETKKPTKLIQHVTDASGNVNYSLFVTCKPIFDDKGEVEYAVGYSIPIEKIYEMYEDSQSADGEILALEIKEETGIICESESMKDVLALARQISDTDTTVLITGDTGSGKNVLASYIHDNSQRKDGPFVEINCAALPENLLEAELFGYEKGAFTGANLSGKAGLFDEASKGTLFLDEINSLPISLQGKLLRALEQKKIRRVGGTKDIKVDFRLITATNEPIKNLVDRGEFREDLYYRLNVVSINVPPLRDRIEDIIPLTVFFMNKYCENYKRRKTLTQNAYNQLLSYSFPGNVRELKNIAERLVILTSRDAREIDVIPESFFDENSDENKNIENKKSSRKVFVLNTPDSTTLMNKGISLKQYLEECEKNLLSQVLNQTKSTYKAAEILDTSQSTVARLKLKYGIE